MGLDPAEQYTRGEKAEEPLGMKHRSESKSPLHMGIERIGDHGSQFQMSAGRNSAEQLTPMKLDGLELGDVQGWLATQ